MWLDPGQGPADNEGPHCRNCHTGANSCNQCHENAPSAGGNNLVTENKSIYKQGAWVHTNAVASLAGACVDGGFSFPHRTLGKDMLKDELYGVDFDGSVASVGATRNANGYDAAGYQYAAPWARSDTNETALSYSFTGSIYDSSAIYETGQQLDNPANGYDNAANIAENLDSVCIDCHGDATTWKGDEPATYEGAKGWELMWKGLP